MTEEDTADGNYDDTLGRRRVEDDPPLEGQLVFKGPQEEI